MYRPISIGCLADSPLVGITMTIFLLSLAGVPPTGGLVQLKDALHGGLCIESHTGLDDTR
jgi:NADH:ubiquinone oxidoreductase subunit 5 (subunit L)/multisubunit Na+/H+ antiporter MnhA subunit